MLRLSACRWAWPNMLATSHARLVAMRPRNCICIYEEYSSVRPRAQSLTSTLAAQTARIVKLAYDARSSAAVDAVRAVGCAATALPESPYEGVLNSACNILHGAAVSPPGAAADDVNAPRVGHRGRGGKCPQ